MMMESVKEQILKIFKSTHIGTMTTISGGKPFSRYMTFQNKDFVLYTVTEKIQTRWMTSSKYFVWIWKWRLWGHIRRNRRESDRIWWRNTKIKNCGVFFGYILPRKRWYGHVENRTNSYAAHEQKRWATERIGIPFRIEKSYFGLTEYIFWYAI